MEGALRFGTALAASAREPPPSNDAPRLAKCSDKLRAKVTSLVEDNDVQEGAVAVEVEAGGGAEKPRLQEGDLVAMHVHCAADDAAETALFTTMREHGGTNVPLLHVLGAPSGTLFRGMQIALASHLRDGDAAHVAIRDDYAYGHRDCKLERPAALPPKVGVRLIVAVTKYDGEASFVGDNPAIVKRVLSEGTGWETPRAPFTVWVSVSASVRDASTPDGGARFLAPPPEPEEITVGDGTLPAGLEAALCYMRAGERASVVITDMEQLTDGDDRFRPPPQPPSHRTPPRKPALARAVTYDVALARMVQVRDMTGDNAVTKRRDVEGRGHFPGDCCIEDGLVRVRYRATASNTVLEDRMEGDPVEIRTGMGECCEAIDMSVRLMLPGETSTVTSTAKYAYDSVGADRRPAAWGDDARRGRTVFTIEMVSFERNVNWHKAPLSELREDARRIKEMGNMLYGAGDVERAKDKYTRALRLLSGLRHVPPAEAEAIALDLIVPIQLNIAACALKQGNAAEARKHTDAALVLDPQNFKAQLRRAAAAMEMADHEDARKRLNDLLASLGDDASDGLATKQRTEVRATLAKLEARVARHKHQERAMARSMVA